MSLSTRATPTPTRANANANATPTPTRANANANANARRKSDARGRGRRRDVARGAASDEPKKLWGGRFSEAQDPLMEKFNESLSFDRRMWREDVEGSVGYARALARAEGDHERPRGTR